MAVHKVVLVSPRGFCAGVARAVKAVEDTLGFFGAPVYVKHEIVHNKHVVKRLSEKGAITVETLSEVPDGSVVVFSAHGSPRAHYDEAKRKKLTLIDATCPLVTKVHLEMVRYVKEGYEIVYVGHHGHPEGIGVLGEVPDVHIPIVETVAEVEALAPSTAEKMIYLTQTTLSIDETKEVIAALKRKYPQIVAPPLEDICYATTNRQGAVKELAKVVDVVLIVGSQTSSNSKRLMEVAKSIGKESYLIDHVSELNQGWLTDAQTVGVSAGASAPEEKVQELVSYFRDQGAVIEDLVVKSESMKFAEPLELMHIRRERMATV